MKFLLSAFDHIWKKHQRNFQFIIYHVLLIDSFLTQRGYFPPRKPLNQLEISALTEC